LLNAAGKELVATQNTVEYLRGQITVLEQRNLNLQSTVERMKNSALDKEDVRSVHIRRSII
jgi:hypothetical protein